MQGREEVSGQAGKSSYLLYAYSDMGNIITVSQWRKQRCSEAEYFVYNHGSMGLAFKLGSNSITHALSPTPHWLVSQRRIGGTKEEKQKSIKKTKLQV